MLSTTFQSWRRSASPEGDPPHLTVSPVTGIAPQSHLPLIVPGLHRTRGSSALSLERRPLQPTSDVQNFIGYVETTTDALRLVMAAHQGIIPRITRRLNDSERRSMIRSGAVFVFCVEESGIKRWTEGLSWSPSRIVGNFLVCRCFPQCGHGYASQGRCHLDVPRGRRAEFKSGSRYCAIPPRNVDLSRRTTKLSRQLILSWKIGS
jgi:hypothetical protein